MVSRTLVHSAWLLGSNTIHWQLLSMECSR